MAKYGSVRSKVLGLIADYLFLNSYATRDSRCGGQHRRPVRDARPGGRRPPRCSAPPGRAAAIGTAFTQETSAAARKEWRVVAGTARTHPRFIEGFLLRRLQMGAPNPGSRPMRRIASGGRR